MTETTISYLLYVGSMVLMLGVQFFISAMISESKHTLTGSVKDWLLKNDGSGFKWLWQHERYLVYYVFRAAIVGIALANVGQFIKEDIFTRNPFIQYAQPTFWSCILYIIYDYKRLWDLFESKTLP